MSCWNKEGCVAPACPSIPSAPRALDPAGVWPGSDTVPASVLLIGGVDTELAVWVWPLVLFFAGCGREAPGLDDRPLNGDLSVAVGLSVTVSAPKLGRVGIAGACVLGLFRKFQPEEIGVAFVLVEKALDLPIGDGMTPLVNEASFISSGCEGP